MTARKTRQPHAFATGALLFGAGIAAGAIGYALNGPFRPDIVPEVQAGALVAFGGIVAAALAMAAAWWGGSLAAGGARAAAVTAARAATREGREARKEARQQAVRDEQRALVRRIINLSNRHAQEVADQVAARVTNVGSTDDQPLPDVDKTTPIEDAINELYALGAQHTADLAWVLLRSLWKLDQSCYIAKTGVPIQRLNAREFREFLIWQGVQRNLKTSVIDAHLESSGGDRMNPDGTLGPADLLLVAYQVVESELEAEMGPPAQ